ncbi:MAG: type II secretion system protein N [Rubrivivax sp.]|nr:type II secretion system protein N [Rubrivivax sp.]
MKRWAALGVVAGVLIALLVFAPATWLAGAVARATSDRLVLADARGTVWQGSAVVVLTGGSGSRDASALPGRLHWRLGLDGSALALRARQACCLNGEVRLRVVPGLGRLRLELPPNAAAGAAGGPLGQWPASWLAGLGTPWNTLQPAGTLQLSTPGLWLEQVQGRWRFHGRADLALGNMASRLSTLETLGSYRLLLVGDAASGDAATLQLSTTGGALQLSGSGQLLGGGAASQLRFRGQASAEVGSEAVLNNLLNIIGRRQGAVSVISIG